MPTRTPQRIAKALRRLGIDRTPIHPSPKTAPWDPPPGTGISPATWQRMTESERMAICWSLLQWEQASGFRRRPGGLPDKALTLRPPGPGMLHPNGCYCRGAPPNGGKIKFCPACGYFDMDRAGLEILGVLPRSE